MKSEWIGALLALRGSGGCCLDLEAGLAFWLRFGCVVAAF